MPHMLAYSEVPSEWAKDKTFGSETSSPAHLMKNEIVLRWTEMNGIKCQKRCAMTQGKKKKLLPDSGGIVNHRSSFI